MTTIILGAVSTFLLGMLWYGPVFGKAWMKMMGVSHESMAEKKKDGMAGKMFIMAVLTIVTATVVQYLLPELLSLSYKEFLKTILIIWLGFGFPVQMGAYLWECKPFKLVLFNAVESILSFTLLSAIIYYWQ